ncbi:MAG: alanine racemase, partial [Candidatus Uhrbacteria bacterium]|nr:alanine racemase [Candidatus Uhrbacteria bacterium]
YGHGLVEVARVCDGLGAPFFVVDSYVEALILRNEQIRSPILIIGYTLPENIRQCHLENVAFTVGNIGDLEKIVSGAERPTRIHLKVDSGMHRQGIMPCDVPRALDILKQSHAVRLEGIGTHLADADGTTPDKTHAQIVGWNAIVQQVRAAFPDIQYVHCANTEGAKFSKEIEANVVRPGMGLYGCTRTSGASIEPALEMATIVTSVRTVKKGESIGYNCTFTAPHDMRIATIPVGYAEGVDRRLSNTGACTIRNELCPIVGRVSMNITSLDVTQCSREVAIGDEVVVISRDSRAVNSCESMARMCGTIPYDILVHIPSTLRRTIKR